MAKQKPLYYLLTLFSIIGYAGIAYGVQRHESVLLLLVFGALFLMYGLIIRQQDSSIEFWIGAAFLFRLIFLFALPSLSDDFYRFIWDGRLWSAGYHPFLELPSTYVQQGIGGIDQQLFSKLNSPQYFAIYPPVSQFVYWLSVKVSPHSILGSVIFMRALLIAAEVGSVLIMQNLLKRFALPAKRILIYALNPLVIIELVGNLHFEALIIFFVLLVVYFLVKNRWVISAGAMALAIGSKLLPLIFLPALASMLGVKNVLRYGFLLILILFVFFIPMYNSQVINGMSESLGLYFNKFEFNASVYYLVREFGFWQYGYNIIQTVGWKLGLIAGILILAFSFGNGLKWSADVDIKAYPKLLSDWMWVLCIYFLFATIVHPWYITTLLALSVFTSYRFVVLWTGLIFLSYVGYSQTEFNEVLWITACEYLFVIGYLIFELRNRFLLINR